MQREQTGENKQSETLTDKKRKRDEAGERGGEARRVAKRDRWGEA